jgi:NMD protein affecting ribosome stability and mRNA decay
MKRGELPRNERRGDRLIRERVHDPYKTRLKLPDPTVCPRCGAVFHKGRWTWESALSEAYEELCQACRRVNDGYPAGIVTLRGTFLKTHRTEILSQARNQEKMEKSARPLHRIMAIKGKGEEIEITTTDIHLPRRIGQALHNAYKGEFDFHYDEEGYFVRVNWTRENGTLG